MYVAAYFSLVKWLKLEFIVKPFLQVFLLNAFIFFYKYVLDM